MDSNQHTATSGRTDTQRPGSRTCGKALMEIWDDPNSELARPREIREHRERKTEPNADWLSFHLSGAGRRLAGVSFAKGGIEMGETFEGQ